MSMNHIILVKITVIFLSICGLVLFFNGFFCPKEKINELLEIANYCNDNSECVEIDTGCFGCDALINKNADISEIRFYIWLCGTSCNHDCETVISAKCQNEKCLPDRVVYSFP